MVIKHCRGLNKRQLPPPAALGEKHGAGAGLNCRWPRLLSAPACLLGAALGLLPESHSGAEPCRSQLSP